MADNQYLLIFTGLKQIGVIVTIQLLKYLTDNLKINQSLTGVYKINEMVGRT